VSQTSSLRRDFLLMLLRDHYEEIVQFPIDIGDDIGGVYDWNIRTIPQAQLDGASRVMPMGRVVGGGSILNGMVWNVYLPLVLMWVRVTPLTPSSAATRTILTIGIRSTILGGIGVPCFHTSRR
jgi:hypothetical protein